MALHFLNIRCYECGQVYSVRKPKDSLLISRIVATAFCPYCHPEALADVCAACRLPMTLFPRSRGRGNKRHGMCFACYQNLRRTRIALQRPTVE